MAALNRPTEATYEIHENITVDTQDNEDHTFCGIMFPVKCKDLLPLDHLVIKSVAVRGYLGPLTVWVSKEAVEEHGNDSTAVLARTRRHKFKLKAKHWDKLYERTHSPSIRQYCDLKLDKPIILKPGQVRAIYIHSTLPGDQAIVYDNSSYYGNTRRYEDDKLAIHSGRAHVSTQVFGQRPIWGWGNAWRENREFVGKLEYGTVYKLWNPYMHPKFGNNFQQGARALLMCQRRWGSPWSLLPDECIYYILNMCRWDWFEDDSRCMKQRRKREKARLREQQLLARQQDAQAQASAPAVAEDVAATAAATAAATPRTGENDVALCKKAGGQCGSDAIHAEVIVENRPRMQDNNHGTADDEDEDNDDWEDADQEGDDDDDGEMEWNDDDDDDNDNEEAVSAGNNDSSSDDDDDDWSGDGYHRANIRAFDFTDVDSDVSDEEQDDDDDDEHDSDDDDHVQAGRGSRSLRQQWLRRQLLRALGADYANVRIVFDDDDDDS